MPARLRAFSMTLRTSGSSSTTSTRPRRANRRGGGAGARVGSWVVCGINNLQLAHIAGHAGAPKVQCAGVDLLRKLGQSVAKGDILYRVHARFPADLAFARQACASSNGYTIGTARDVPQVSTEF